MLKALVKKQLTEIFRMYFYDQKKGQARTKGSTVAMFIFFTVVIVGVLGGMFGYLAYSLRSILAIPDMAWFYFALLGLLSTVLGVFGSVFNTYSSLYLAKDNDLILSMPIPVNTVIFSRLFSVYLMGALYSSTVMVPALVIFFIYGALSAASVLGAILFTVIITLFVFILSCLLGYIVAKISVKLKNRSFITVLISLVFIAVYYFLYYKANNAIMDILNNVVIYGEKVKGNAYPVYLFGKIGEGDPVACIVFTAAIAALIALTWFLIQRSFIKTAVSASITVAKTTVKEDRSKQKSVFGALLWKEFKRFTASPQYMLNCGLGLIFMPAVTVFIIISGGKLNAALSAPDSPFNGTTAVIICAVIMFMVSTVDITAPSISLEGKNIWITQSLPADPWQIFKAKLAVQLILVTLPVLVCSVAAVFVFDISAVEAVFVIIYPIIYCVFSAMFGLYLGIRHPNLTWTSEIVPIKQSLPVFITLFGGWAFGAAFGFVFFLFKSVISSVVYLIAATAITVLLSIWLLYYLKNSGAKKFASL